MPFKKNGSIRYFSFDIFESAPLIQAVFSRRGGVSPSPWNALNLGSTVGDQLTNVAENRRLTFNAVDRDLESIAHSWLVHGSDVIIVDQPQPQTNDPPPKGDILLTDNPNVTLLMRYADCVPLMLYDPEHAAIGLVHAGWKGTVKRAASVAVTAMQRRYGTNPKDILAAIGPSIAAHHYPVGDNVIEQVHHTFGEQSSNILLSENGVTHFDLWAANQLILEDTGVTQIENPQICTACQLEDWFSHRGEKRNTGRFGALIGLGLK